MNQLTNDSWNIRYVQSNIPWDVGSITPPLKKIIDEQISREIKVLVPGAGNGHEAEYLYRQGFKNTYICDWAENAIQSFQKRVPDFPKNNCLVMDFFEISDQFDLILEQTFLCALHPTKRNQYAAKMASILKPNGILTGVIFKELPIPEGPPFGGKLEEYSLLFNEYFEDVKLDECENSVEPRMGNELLLQAKNPISKH